MRCWTIWLWRTIPWLLPLAIIGPFVRNFVSAQRAPVQQIVRAIGESNDAVRFSDADLKLKTRPDGTLIYAFGGSSLVCSDRNDHPSSVFPGKLEARLAPRATVVNYAKAGENSFYVRDKLRWSCQQIKPDVVVLYTGHNDYNAAYANLVRPHYTLLSHTPFAWILRAEGKNVDWLIHFAYDPMAHDLLARLHLWRPDETDFRAYDAAIEARFAENLRDMTTFVRQQGIEMVLVTPVGNLLKAPTGNRQLTQAFREALEQSDYDERMAQLLAIRDRDFLSSDPRARKGLLNIIRAIRDEPGGIYVLDLERELLRREYSFSYDRIMDAFHHNEVSHELIAEILAAFLLEHDLVGAAPAPPMP